MKYAISVVLSAVDNTSSALSRASGALGKFRDQAEKSKRASSVFGDVFKGVTLGSLAANGISQAVSGLKNLAVEGLNLASDLTEVQNVVDTTFGGEMSQKVNAWSKSAMKSFGLSELQAKKFSGTLGAMLKSSGLAGSELLQMSTGLSGLAGDFASFYNLDIESAFDKIRAGVSGETEPLKQVGINMSVANLEAFALSKGLRTAWKDMSQAQQVQLRYLYLMKASTDAQGDFSKTLATSYANQKRVLQTNITQAAASAMSVVLPLALKYTKTINDLVPRVSAWIEANKEMIGQRVESAIAAVTSAVKTAWGVFSGVYSAVKSVNDVFGGHLIPAILIGVATFKALNAVMMVGSVVVPALTTAFQVGGAVIAMFQSGAKLATVAQWAFNAAMSANPIGLVITGLAALIAITYLVVKNWDRVKTFFIGMWEKIKGAFASAWEFIANLLKNPVVQGLLTVFMPFIGIPNLIIQNWSKITDFFAGLWKGLSDMMPGWVKKLFGADGGGVSMNVGASPAAGSAPAAAPIGGNPATLYSSKTEKSEVSVKFENIPRGTRVDNSKAAPGLDMSMGYANYGF